MHDRLTYFLVILSLIITTSVFAQHQNLGKIDREVVEMSVYSGDSSAHAVVLFDVGFSYYNFGASGNFTLEMTRHRRVKILDIEGFDEANIEIPFYDPNGNGESVSAIKGYTYYMQDGKVEEVKLERSDIFKVDLYNDWKAYKFTMPNVRPGAVIEFEYKINSDFLAKMRAWSFQEEIPVIYSEYKTQIPEFFNFEKVLTGYLSFSNYGTKKIPLKIGNTLYGSNVEMFAMKDVPAFRSEKYISSPKDYLSGIEYQLASTHFPNQMIVKYMGTWPQMNIELLKSDILGKQIDRSNFLKDIAAGILANNNTIEAQIAAALDYIKGKVKWNGNFHYASKNIRKIWEEGTGDSGDINLLLIALLREMGFNTDPVVGSTREHGKLYPNLPLLDRMNYVLALVQLEDDYLLLDATSDLQKELLPFWCLNGQGWRVSENNSGWIDLYTQGKLQQSTMAVLKLSDEGKLTGDIKNTLFDYSASNARRKIKNEGEKSYKQSEWEENNQIEILEYELLNLDDSQKPLTEMVKFENTSEFLGNRLYLSPFLVKIFEANIFKKESRYYPVDFGVPIKMSYSFSLQLPEGYQVEDIPQGIAYSTADKTASFVFQSIAMANNVQISANLNITKPVFLPEEYTGLRELFTQLISIQDQLLVIKKSDN